MEYILLSGPKQATDGRWEMGHNVIKEIVSTKCFSVQTDDALKWDHHVSELAKSFTQKLNLLKSLYFLLRQARTDFYLRLFCPLLRMVC